MNCETARELLVWYVAGSLSSEETTAVAGHLESCPACRDEAEATRRAARIATSHVPAEVLTDYAFGEEELGFDRAILERHLGHCPSCLEEVALAESASASARSGTRRSVMWPTLALAATLLVGVGIGTLRHSEQGVGSGPRGDVALVELLPSSLTTRGPEDRIRVPPDRPSALVLVTDRVLGEGPFRVRLTSPGDHDAVLVSDLSPMEDGGFVVLLPRGFPIPEGASLVLEAADDAAWRTLETYPLTRSP